MELEKLQDSARRASTLLKAMSNEHRLMILCQLLHGEKSVGEMERIIGLSQSALSQHLARLRRDGLTLRDERRIGEVALRRAGREVHAHLRAADHEGVAHVEARVAHVDEVDVFQ